MNTNEAAPMPVMPAPAPDNGYLAEHVDLLRRSLRALTGCDLIVGNLSAEDAAQRIYRAPFAVLSHDTAPDPILTYANRCALDLFEVSWDQLVQMPSRLTAEAPDRDERARLLRTVAAQGYIDNYAGVRVSRTGRRFCIEAATVWNLRDGAGRCQGQAATFARWRPL
jgi:MEKHLA domain